MTYYLSTGSSGAVSLLKSSTPPIGGTEVPDRLVDAVINLMGADRVFRLVGEEIQVAPTEPPHMHATWNWDSQIWVDSRALQDFKNQQWALIKQARSNAEYAGFTWDGSTFDSDAISQNRITGAVTLAMLSPAFVIDWVLADNTTRLLDQTGMAQVGAALGTHVATQFAKGVMLRAQIEAATTQGEVEAVVW